MQKIKIVKSKIEVKKVIGFLSSKEAFELEMNDFRQRARKDAVYGSLAKDNHRYWFAEDDKGAVIAAIGIGENERRNGGYDLGYFAVHKDHRRKGLGSLLLQEAEAFARSKNGRFILIDTGDTALFQPARLFYEKSGYQAVSHIPDYYEEGDGRIDYYKKFSKLKK